MAAQPTRSYLVIAAAIVIAGVLIAASLFVAMGEVTKTSTSITTITSTTTVTGTVPESCNTSTTLHCVVFQQLGACTPEFWGIPWSVTIGNTTEVQPPGTTLPISNYSLEGTSNENFSVIVFSLPDGHYSFTVSPSAGFFMPTTGSLTIDGTDVLVQIAYTGTSCTVTQTRTETTTSVSGQPIPVAMVETDNFSAAGNAFALNPSTNRMYILGTSSLTVVDLSTDSAIATVPFPANNTGGLINAGLAIDTSTDTVYASVAGEVLEVDGSTNTLVGEIPLPLRTLAFDSATHELWGTMFQEQGPGPQNGSLVGFDVSTGAVLANVSVGFAPYDIAVNPKTNMVYADGCVQDFVCGSEAAIVNGTGGTLLTTVDLGSAYYPTMTLNPATDVLYVSGEQELAALNGTTGSLIFKVSPQTCGPFTGMVVDPSSNLVLTAAANSDYLLAYDGATGNLVNMYSFPSYVGPVAFDSGNSKLYVSTAAGDLIGMHMLAATGNVNSTLISSSGACPPP